VRVLSMAARVVRAARSHRGRAPSAHRGSARGPAIRLKA
jgi:hypothetical protein